MQKGLEIVSNYSLFTKYYKCFIFNANLGTTISEGTSYFKELS